jgi:hypothetical protein
MKKHRFLAMAAFALALWLLLTGIAVAQQAPAATGVPAHIVVTVEPRKGSDVPVIHREDVMVYEGHDRDTVTDWVPAQGDQAPLELFVLLDDASNINLGTQLGDIRKFINAQPDTTKIGVAYMQNGIAQVVQNLTSDHEAAANALRLPLGIGGVNASPYFSLSDLIKRWPASGGRRAVLMVTDGVDRYYGAGDMLDPYLDAAIDDAVRAGIQVSAIYNPDTGHFGHSYWWNYWGQIYLSRMTEETGGEGYYIGFTGSAPTFAPYLDSMEKRLTHQYLLTFLAKPPKKAGWQRVRLRTEVPNADLVSAGRVWVTP